MVFNSLEFALFLPIVYLIYSSIYRCESLRDIFLLIASYIFYMSWYWQYAGLIALSTLVDYAIGKKMHNSECPRRRKLLIIISLTFNLGLLAVFKYFNFFADLSRQSLSWFGIDIPPIYHQLLLPVGISFYTFQTLSYTLDIYRRELKPEKNLTKFAVFVAFFPQLVAGPIVRAKDFLPQINSVPPPTYNNLNKGLTLVFIGLFKKIVIADLLAFLAIDSIFNNPNEYSSWDLLMGLYAYAFQIYCDFSGYSDIAIGVALMLGFHLPINFNRPYIAQSPSDFWRRWHISLSTWLRDYLYISLGGNRGKKWHTSRNLILTMLLGGLWHGAATNFILWGAYHGLLLMIFKPFSTTSTSYQTRYLRIALMFHLSLFGWLLFRVTDMQNFIDFISGVSKLTSGTQLGELFYLILAGTILWHFLPAEKTREQISNTLQSLPTPIKAGTYAGLLLAFIGLSLMEPSFIYFQF